MIWRYRQGKGALSSSSSSPPASSSTRPPDYDDCAQEEAVGRSRGDVATDDSALKRANNNTISVAVTITTAAVTDRNAHTKRSRMKQIRFTKSKMA
jgi:hypothetical protein